MRFAEHFTEVKHYKEVEQIVRVFQLLIGKGFSMIHSLLSLG